MADIIVKKGSRIIIEVTKPENSQVKPTSQTKGIIKSRREPEYLARRKKTPKGIRIFDLGRLASGADIQFKFSPEFTDNINVEPMPYVPEFLFPAAAVARDELLLSMVAGNNFESVFFEIKQTDGDFYKMLWFNAGESVDISADSDRWRSGGSGLNLNGFDLKAMLLVYESYAEHNSTWLHPIILPESKITSEYDFDAAEVEEFEIAENDLIFWMPSLPTFRCYTSYGNYPDNIEAVLGNDFRFGLRNFFLADNAPEINPNSEEASSFESDNYEDAYQAIHLHVAFPDQRCYRREQAPGGGTVIWTEVGPEEILPNPPFSTGDVSSSNFYIESKIVNFSPATGTLLAIVKRGGQLFYIWQNEI